VLAVASGFGLRRYACVVISDQPPAPSLYRIWLKTAGDRMGVERTCLREGLLGLGWGYHWGDEPVPDPVTWKVYHDWAYDNWGGKMGPVRTLHDAEEDCLVWTRTADGMYYLAQFTDGWQYRDERRFDDLDLNNTRPARIERVGTENRVPGSVVRSLSRPGAALCRVKDHGAARYSALLWADLTGEEYVWSPTVDEILVSLLSPLDVEDLVAAYLQVKRGWLLLPSRLNSNTAAYEYVLIEPKTGHQYAVQVKTGTSTAFDLSRLDTAKDLQGWVVYATDGSVYRGRQPDHVDRLDTADLKRFMIDYHRALPPIIQTWLSTARD
jgi:hypothetical protein